MFFYSPTYWDYWSPKDSIGLKTEQAPKELWFYDSIENNGINGNFGPYSIKHKPKQSKELRPLVIPLKGFEPNEIIKFSYDSKKYEFPASVCAFAVRVGTGVGVHIGVRVGVSVSVRIGVINNDPYYIGYYKWNEFQEAFKESGQKYCLYDCLVFIEIGSQPIRALLPWFMIEEK